MDTLAKALMLAIGHIERRSAACTEDDDVAALEDIAAAFADASRQERQAVATAAAALGMAELPDQLGIGPYD